MTVEEQAGVSDSGLCVKVLVTFLSSQRPSQCKERKQGNREAQEIVGLPEASPSNGEKMAQKSQLSAIAPPDLTQAQWVLLRLEEE
ncbi:hypothetical protein P7K49_029707 [Saguinus oedipus]|uniref:Uncharacterized protein n=1 Tax=Saguinus oedipus TaxID=9490 RepID=A0ABQ9U7Z3_SAGOE|nr:hypothetical protein P7K49_029707 [Saguinus oedipus]